MTKDKLKIVFVGMPDMALVCLSRLLEEDFNIVGVVPPKKTHETYNYFREFVKYRNLNLIEFENSCNEYDCIKQIEKLNADIVMPASEQCENMKTVASKVGVTVVCDEEA